MIWLLGLIGGLVGVYFIIPVLIWIFTADKFTLTNLKNVYYLLFMGKGR